MATYPINDENPPTGAGYRPGDIVVCPQGSVVPRWKYVGDEQWVPANVVEFVENEVTGRIGFPLEGQWSDNLQLLRAQIIGKTPEFYETLSGVTITLGSANGNPTIASAVTIAKDSAVLSHSCRTEVDAAWPNSQYRYPMTKDNKATGTAAGYATGDVSSSYFETNAATLEFAIKGVGVSARGRIWVTEKGVRRVAGVIPTVPSDGARYWVKVEFGSAAMRTVEIEIANGYFGGFAVGPSDLYARHELSGLHVMVVGDSYTEGTGTTNGVLNLDGYANRLARLLGAQRRTMSGLGGTGYLANNSNARKSLLERVQTDVIDLAPDIVIHANGINDTLDGINSNAPQVFDTIKAALPNCVQIVFGPFQPRSIDVEARRAALQAICAARGLLFIDNVTDNEITGTGYQSSPQRDGNSDIVIGGDAGTDVTHPTLFGHEYIARWRFKALCRAIGI